MPRNNLSDKMKYDSDIECLVWESVFGHYFSGQTVIFFMN